MCVPRIQCIQQVGELVRGKVIVGHALQNDLQVRSRLMCVSKYTPYIHTLHHHPPVSASLSNPSYVPTHSSIYPPTQLSKTQALLLQHPVSQLRDTARYRPYMRPHGRDGGKLRPRRLKDLAEEVLGMEIQAGKHDSVRCFFFWGGCFVLCCALLCFAAMCFSFWGGGC